MDHEPLTLTPQAFLVDEWTAAGVAPPAPPVELRLVTWNTWFGGHMFEDRTLALLAELERRRPDVIALQEVTPILLEALRDMPWVQRDYQLSEPDVYAYDVMLLSRHPLRGLTSLELPSAMGRRLLVAELACGLRVATVHLESTAGCAAERAAQLRIVQPFLAGHRDVALVGDMNFAPGAALEEAALDPSFVDVWAQLRAAEPGYTVDTDVNTMRRATHGAPARKRIDRVFLRGPTWRAASIELIGTAPVDLDGTFISDHFGLAVTLQPRPA